MKFNFETNEETAFYQQHINDFIVICAKGDWFEGCPKNYVWVLAVKGIADGSQVRDLESAEFYVPIKEYHNRSGYGFVIDPVRHLELANRYEPEPI